MSTSLVFHIQCLRIFSYSCSRFFRRTVFQRIVCLQFLQTFLFYFSELCTALKPLTAGRLLILCVISVQDKSVDLRWKATEAFKGLLIQVAKQCHIF